MAHGSEDYWMTKSRLFADLLESIIAAISTDGSVITALDGIDGKVDNVITLDQLNSGACELLARMLGVETAVTAGGAVLNALDALDGTMDGKLTAAELTAVQVDLLTQLTSINVNLATGSDILNALDGLDGTMDGKLTVAELTTVQAELLGKLTGIDTSVTTGGNLINKLDALDGTMDGKLDLAQLNTSAVKTNLDTAITKLTDVLTALNSSLTKLDTQITNLIDVKTNTSHIGATGYTVTWSFPTAIKRKVLGSWASRFKVLFRSHAANDLLAYIGHDTDVSNVNYDFIFNALDSLSWETVGEVWIRTYAAGNCTVYITDVG